MIHDIIMPFCPRWRSWSSYQMWSSVGKISFHRTQSEHSWGSWNLMTQVWIFVGHSGGMVEHQHEHQGLSGKVPKNPKLTIGWIPQMMKIKIKCTFHSRFAPNGPLAKYHICLNNPLSVPFTLEKHNPMEPFDVLICFYWCADGGPCNIFLRGPGARTSNPNSCSSYL